jgi:hypothetical protein
MPRAYHAIKGLSSVRPEVGAPYSGTGAPEPLTLAQQIRGMGSALSIAKVAKIVGPGNRHFRRPAPKAGVTAAHASDALDELVEDRKALTVFFVEHTSHRSDAIMISSQRQAAIRVQRHHPKLVFLRRAKH